jgi:choline dehydrogenase-like flavoprotein
LSISLTNIKRPTYINIDHSDEGAIEIIVPGLFYNISTSTKYGWGYVTTPQIGLNNRSLPYSQARVLGGSSSHSKWRGIIVLPFVSGKG